MSTKWLRKLVCVSAFSAFAHGATLLTEGFDDVSTLAGSGWASINNSSPLGSTGWFQGNPTIFPAHSGAANSYIAANFNNADFGGNISNWLITPILTLDNGVQLDFFTRTEFLSEFADRLEVRMSTNDGSTNVGSTDSSVGDFTNLLLTINPSLLGSGYPQDWTAFSATISGLDSATTGRLAFRYFVPDTSTNGDYIGIDTVTITSVDTVVPEPSTIGLSLLGLGGVLAGLRRRRT